VLDGAVAVFDSVSGASSRSQETVRRQADSTKPFDLVNKMDRICQLPAVRFNRFSVLICFDLFCFFCL
jgi:hypothetical protein